MRALQYKLLYEAQLLSRIVDKIKINIDLIDKCSIVIKTIFLILLLKVST